MNSVQRILKLKMPIDVENIIVKIVNQLIYNDVMNELNESIKIDSVLIGENHYQCALFTGKFHKKIMLDICQKTIGNLPCNCGSCMTPY